MGIPRWYGHNIAASEALIRLALDGGMHGPGDHSVQVVGGLMQLLGGGTRWQPDRMQPNRRHNILRDLDTLHATAVVEDGRKRNTESRIAVLRALEWLSIMSE